MDQLHPFEEVVTMVKLLHPEENSSDMGEASLTWSFTPFLLRAVTPAATDDLTTSVVRVRTWEGVAIVVRDSELGAGHHIPLECLIADVLLPWSSPQQPPAILCAHLHLHLHPILLSTVRHLLLHHHHLPRGAALQEEEEKQCQGDQASLYTESREGICHVFLALDHRAGLLFLWVGGFNELSAAPPALALWSVKRKGPANDCRQMNRGMPSPSHVEDLECSNSGFCHFNWLQLQ